MADDILQNTLTGTTLPATPQALQAPTLSGNNPQDISNLKSAQQNPQNLLNLQKALQLTSNTAYKERQAGEMTQASKQFDPTKVSGGTFASIIGNLEQNRGADISKIYGSTMNTYTKVQEQITERLQFLEQLEEQKRQFEQEYKLEKKKIKILEKQDKRTAKAEKERLKMEKANFEMEYAKKKQQLKQDTDYLNVMSIAGLRNEYYGGGNYNTPSGISGNDWWNSN